MAKISARGCYKIAEAIRTVTKDGDTWKYIDVLRSDGVVLTSFAHVSSTNYALTSYDRKRSTYRRIGKLVPILSDKDNAEKFKTMMENRGYVVKIFTSSDQTELF